jgi:hypothetical protein
MEKRKGSSVSNSELLDNSKIDSNLNHSTDYFEDWKRCIENANLMFDESDFIQAELLYQKTINIAISAFSEQTMNKHTISVLLVSFHNIADLYSRQERYLDVLVSLEAAFVYIKTKLDGVMPNSDEAVDLTWGLMKARRQLLTFTSQKDFKTSNATSYKHKNPKNNHSNHVH